MKNKLINSSKLGITKFVFNNNFSRNFNLKNNILVFVFLFVTSYSFADCSTWTYTNQTYTLSGSFYVDCHSYSYIHHYAWNPKTGQYDIPVYFTGNCADTYINCTFNITANSQIISSCYGCSFVNCTFNFQDEDLTLTTNYYGIAFSDCTFNFDANCAMVANNTCSITGSDLTGEDWYGVTAGSSSFLNVANCFIEGAEKAINAQNGSNVLVRSTEFYNNYIGIFVKETNTGVPNTTKLTALFNEFWGSANGINNPFVGNRSYSGITLYDMPDPNITNGNYFHDIQNGIMLYNSSMVDKNHEYSYVSEGKGNHYKNIQPAIINQFSDEYGNGIYIDGGDKGNVNLEYDGASHYSISSFSISSLYNFINCKVGIHAINATLNLNFNDFSNCERGIVEQGVNSSDTKVNIYNNSFTNSTISVDMLNNFLGPTGYIEANTITGGDNSVNGIGIRVKASLSLDAVSLIIKNNTIAVNRKGMTGVQASGVEYLTIFDNDINISNVASYKGIHVLDGCGNIGIFSNTITGSSPAWINNLSDEYNGIKIEGCMQADVGCNTISGVGAGLQILDDCSSSQIYKNNFATSGVGLLYCKPFSYPGKSGEQDGMLNTWTGSFSKYPAWYSLDPGSSDWILESLYYADQSNSLYYPTGIHSEVSGIQWFYDGTGSAPACKSYKPEPDTDLVNPTETQLVGNHKSTWPTEFAYEWNVRWNFYNKIVRSPSLVTAGVVTYKAFEDTTAIGKLHAAWNTIRNFNGLNSTQQTRLNTLQSDALVLFDTLDYFHKQAIDEIINDDTISSTTKGLIDANQTRLNSVMLSLDTLCNLNSTNKSDAIEDALDLLAYVSAAGNVKAYNKTVVDIYLQTLAQNIYPDSTQIVTLQTIANSCPNVDGRGVFWARNLLGIIFPMDTTHYIKWCEDTIEYRADNNFQRLENNILLAPNPGNDQLVISNLEQTNLNKGVTIEIFDLTGRSIIKKSEVNTSTTIIDTSSLLSGFYFVIIKQQNSILTKSWIKQ